MPLKPICLNLPTETIDLLDRIRGNISRSKAISCLLGYVCTDEATIKAVIPKPVSYEEYYNLQTKKESVT